MPRTTDPKVYVTPAERMQVKVARFIDRETSYRRMRIEEMQAEIVALNNLRLPVATPSGVYVGLNTFEPRNGEFGY
jgi:hypothetical protein